MVVIFVMGSVKVDFKGDNINIVSRVLLMIKSFLNRRGGGCSLCVFVSENLDRIYHVFEYFVFTFLVYYALKKTRGKRDSKENYILAGMIVILIGIFDELHQILTPTRFCSFFDLLADGFGMALMTMFLILYELKLGRRNAV